MHFEPKLPSKNKDGLEFRDPSENDDNSTENEAQSCLEL